MAIRQLHKQIWVNPEHITHILLWNDPEDGDLEKARVYFVGQTEPLELTARDTLRLLSMIEPPKSGKKGSVSF